MGAGYLRIGLRKRKTTGIGKHQRYVLEALWGEGALKHEVCHRQIIFHPGYYRKIEAVVFPNGSSFRLLIREAQEDEVIDEINRFGPLLSRIIDLGLKGIINAEGLE